jgi:hypothetical protein
VSDIDTGHDPEREDAEEEAYLIATDPEYAAAQTGWDCLAEARPTAGVAS